MAKKTRQQARGRKTRSGGATRRKIARPATRRRIAARKNPAKKLARRSLLRLRAKRDGETSTKLEERSRGGGGTARAARKPARKDAKAAKPASRATARPSAPAPRATRAAKTKAPALDRQRRTLEDTVPTPPSSLNLDRHGSAARTGRAELRERLKAHTETSPALTAGDIDANWEEAYRSGDEAPGGNNPTPDESVVDDIGKALGVEYDDNEELKGTAKIEQRDAKRWELDPASSEDYKDRTKK